MIKTYKYKSKAANAIVFLAGLITYMGKDMLTQILPTRIAYLAPIIVLIAGYIVVQTTENTRVIVAEQLAVENYQNTIGVDANATGTWMPAWRTNQ